LATISFEGTRPSDASRLERVFALVSEGKRGGRIDEHAVWEALGQTARLAFVTEKAEADEWLREWQADRSIQMPWDFGSWIDAFMNADIDLRSIRLTAAGEGEITFEQLSHPSGGIDATEEIVRVFGGTVVASDAL
jgi:hypothetical protein